MPRGEEDVRAFLRGIVASLGASEAVLTVHPHGDTSQGSAAADANGLLSAEAHAGLAMQATSLLGAMVWAADRGQTEWSRVLLDGLGFEVLRVPVTSRRGGSSAVVSILFESASIATRLPGAERVTTMRPIIDSYFRLWQRSRTGARGVTGLHCALDSMDLGIILVDQTMRIAFANKAANAFLGAELHIRRTGSTFSATDLRQSLGLQVALSHAVTANRGSAAGAGCRSAPTVALRSLVSGQPLVLAVVPADQPAVEPHDIAAIVYLLDPKLDVAVQLEPVCRLYKLTPVEARLVCKLMAGLALQEAAQAIGVKEQTARSYLKQIFLKTSTRRQADLVRVMLSSLMPTRRDIEPDFLS